MMPLRRLLMFLIGVLVLLAFLLGVNEFQRSRAAYRNASTLIERNALADLCVQAARNFVFEWGRSLVALHSGDVIRQDQVDFIRQRRSEADETIGAILSRVDSEIEGDLDILRQAWERVHALRSEVDRNVGQAFVQRDRSLTERWPAAADRLILSLENLVVDSSGLTGRHDAEVVRLGTLRLLAMQFRNVLGFESSIIASGLSSGQPLTHQAMAGVNQLRGRSAQLGAQLEQHLSQVSNPDLTIAFENLRLALRTGLRPLQDEILAAGESHQKTRVDLNDYFAKSYPVLDLASELGESINRAATTTATQRLQAASQRQLFAVICMVLALVVAASVIWLLMRRFTRPLNEIAIRVNTLLAAHAAPAAKLSRRCSAADEFDKIKSALELLEEAVKARMLGEQEQAKQNKLLTTLLGTIPAGVFMVEAPSRKLLVANDAARMLLGPKAFEGTDGLAVCGSLSLYQLPERTPYPEDRLPLIRGLNGECSHIDDLLLVDAEGQETILEVMGAPVVDGEGHVWACVVSCVDITERSRTAAEMSRLAYYDYLTQLPNRRLFHDRMQMAITRAKREEGRLALLLIDLDRFKPVNDNLGHAIGDKLLKAVAGRMQFCLRESDTLARIGGDEFVAILSGIEVADDALHVAEKIRLALNEPFDIEGGYKISIACCVGVAIYPEHGKDEKRLVKCADDAMYLAKEHGRNSVSLFDGVGMVPHAGRQDRQIVRLVWHQAYRCGEPSIDQEHKELFDQANVLIYASMSGDAASVAVGKALDDLIEVVTHHFANEETVLEQCQYPGLEEHRLKHQRLVGEALQLRELSRAGEVTTGDLVSFLANDVVLRHMLGEDRKFYPYLKISKPHSAGDQRVDFREQ